MHSPELGGAHCKLLSSILQVRIAGVDEQGDDARDGSQACQQAVELTRQDLKASQVQIGRLRQSLEGQREVVQGVGGSDGYLVDHLPLQYGQAPCTSSRACSGSEATAMITSQKEHAGTERPLAGRKSRHMHLLGAEGNPQSWGSVEAAVGGQQGAEPDRRAGLG